MTNAEAWFNNSLRPRKPEGSLGRTAQDVHLDSHTAPEQWVVTLKTLLFCTWGLASLSYRPHLSVREPVWPSGKALGW